MDLDALIAHLRLELHEIDQAILALERMAPARRAGGRGGSRRNTALPAARARVHKTRQPYRLPTA
jgi:hypothetical protein